MVASYAFPIVLLPCLAIRVGKALGSETILPVALLFLCWPLVQAYWEASARQHGFGGIQSDQRHRPQMRSWSRACMPCAYKR